MRKQTVSIVIPVGSPIGQSIEIDVEFDKRFCRCKGVVAYTTSSVPVTCRVGMKDTVGDYVLDQTHYDEYSGNSAVAVKDRYVPLDVPTGYSYTVVVTPRAVIATEETFDMVFALV